MPNIAAQRKDIFGAERFQTKYLNMFEASMKAQEAQQTRDEERNEILRRMEGKMTVYKPGTEPKTVEINKPIGE